jgi:hypothetical protein
LTGGVKHLIRTHLHPRPIAPATAPATTHKNDADQVWHRLCFDEKHENSRIEEAI